MRFMNLVGLYWKPAGQGSLQSGIYYSTQPTDVPLGALAVERARTANMENVYELVRVSGTCTVGALLYATGSNNSWVVCTGTGAGKPWAVSMAAPTASGMWQWALRHGIHTSLQMTVSVGGTAATSGFILGGESAGLNISSFFASITGAISQGATAFYPVIGRALTAVAEGTSTTIGFIDLL